MRLAELACEADLMSPIGIIALISPLLWQLGRVDGQKRTNPQVRR